MKSYRLWVTVLYQKLPHKKYIKFGSVINSWIILKNFITADFFFKNIYWFLTSRLFKKNYYYILKKRLINSDSKNEYKLNLKIEKASDEEIKNILKNAHDAKFEEKKEIIHRIIFYKNGFKNCFLVKKENGEIIHMQWLIFPNENKIILKKYKNKFQVLNKNQVILENAYTFPRYRGLSILKLATNELMNIAKKENYKTAIGYIRVDNLRSLNEFLEMGFKITGIIPEYKLFGIAKRVFKRKIIK